jgi:SAM-dependent methyltransferase
MSPKCRYRRDVTVSAADQRKRAAAPDASCPACGDAARPFLSARDRNRESTDERFNYLRCERCATLFVWPLPQTVLGFYGGNYYGFGTGGEAPWERDSELRVVERARMQLVRAHVEPGVLIELGSGAGGFAAAARDAGYAVTAIEMDPGCCKFLHERLGVCVIESDSPAAALAELGPARVVAMWHVLEHLPNPREVLARSAAALEPGGLLAIGVPNLGALQFRLLRGRWAHLDAPRHLCLIPAQALAALGRDLGLELAALLSDDPFGRVCDRFGWIMALRRRPALGNPGYLATYGGQALALALRPVERSGVRGSALTMLLRKPDK